MRRKPDRNISVDFGPIHEQLQKIVDNHPRRPFMKAFLQDNGINQKLYYYSKCIGKSNRDTLSKLYKLGVNMPLHVLAYIGVDVK